MGTVDRVTADQLAKALGRAVVRAWGTLPQDVQHRLFEEAILSAGEPLRPRLALFLHEKNPLS
jgi:hypothetical protein